MRSRWSSAPESVSPCGVPSRRVPSPRRHAGHGDGSIRLLPVAAACGLLLGSTLLVAVDRASGGRHAPCPRRHRGPGPRPAYRCTFNVDTDAFTGADGTASAIGWLGDHNSVITCLGGTFVVQDGPDGLFQNYGFGIYDGQPTTWADADGYLPAQVTTFALGAVPRSPSPSSPTAIVVARRSLSSRSTAGCHVANPTSRTVSGRPARLPGTRGPRQRARTPSPPTHAVDHDYVVASDRFGTPDRLAQCRCRSPGCRELRPPTSPTCAPSGTASWLRLPRSACPTVARQRLQKRLHHHPDHPQRERPGLGRQRVRERVQPRRGGYLHHPRSRRAPSRDAHALLTPGVQRRRGPQGQYVDAVSGPVRDPGPSTRSRRYVIVLAKFRHRGRRGASRASRTPHTPSRRTGRGRWGPMEATDDIDTEGYWTTDDFEALLGLAAYRYLATALGDADRGLLGARHSTPASSPRTNAVLVVRPSASNHLDDPPCSLTQPNTANRSGQPRRTPTGPRPSPAPWAWRAPSSAPPRAVPARRSSTPPTPTALLAAGPAAAGHEPVVSPDYY